MSTLSAHTLVVLRSPAGSGWQRVELVVLGPSDAVHGIVATTMVLRAADDRLSVLEAAFREIAFLLAGRAADLCKACTE